MIRSGISNNVQKIHATEAWDYQKGSTSIIVAVLDSGVDYNHEDLAGRVIKGYDFANNYNDPMDDHPCSHGTHMAGIIGAIMDNSKGIAGIAQVKILAIKVGDQYRPYPDNVADGIYYAANNSAEIIGMSLSFNSDYERVRRACEYAWSQGALLIASVGNEGQEVQKYLQLMIKLLLLVQ